MYKHLFRYEPFSLEHLKTLTQGKFWMGKGSNFNDPFDCNIDISTDLFGVESFEKLMEDFSKSNRHGLVKDIISPPEKMYTSEELGELQVCDLQPWVESVRDRIRNVAMCCMCEEWDNHQLWSYYAESHTGVCIEYKLNIGQLFHQGTMNMLEPVRYSSHYPICQITELLRSENPTKIVAELMYTKHSLWRHEQEWRYIMLDTSGGQAIDRPDGIEVERVIAGFKMHDDNYEVLRTLCEGVNIACERAQKGKFSFSLNDSSGEDNKWRVIRY